MQNMDLIKKKIYAVPATQSIDLLTTFYVVIGAVGGDGYLGDEAKGIALYDTLLQTSAQRMEDTREIRRNIHELVNLTKDERNWWMIDHRDAAKVYWRIDHFLKSQLYDGFGVVNEKKLPDYKTLGDIANRMLEVMDHYSKAVSKDTYTVTAPVVRTVNELEVDAFIGDFVHTTAAPVEIAEEAKVLRYTNPFAQYLKDQDLDMHSLFRI
jgi:hypothetical protein